MPASRKPTQSVVPDLIRDLDPAQSVVPDPIRDLEPEAFQP